MADTLNELNKRSMVWTKFKIDKNNPKIAICECGTPISRGGNDPKSWGTTGLLKHLKNAKVHKEERAKEALAEKEKALTGPGSQSPLSKYFQTMSQTNNAINYYDADKIPNANATNLVGSDSCFNDVLSLTKVSSNWVNKALAQPTLQETLDKNKLWPIHSLNAHETHKWIGHYMALRFKPFREVETDGFIYMVNHMQPRYKIPSRFFFFLKK